MFSSSYLLVRREIFILELFMQCKFDECKALKMVLLELDHEAAAKFRHKRKGINESDRAIA